MTARDMERLARTLAAQKLEPDYIRHYLMETYQIDAKTVDQIFERVGIGKKAGSNSKQLPKIDPNADRRKRQGF